MDASVLKSTVSGRSRYHTTLVLGGAVLLVGLVAPFTGLYSVMLMKVLCYAIFGLAFNLLIGYAGLLSFGHAAFFGIAAYATGYTAKYWGFNPELAIIAGVAISAALGLLFGLLATRRRGIIFAMVTLALSQMLYFFCLQAPFTGGEDGISGIPRGKLFGVIDLSEHMTMYFVVLAGFMAAFLFVIRVVRSPFGQVLEAVREDERRATSLGYDATRYKLLAFVLSAGLAGFAGSLKALVFQLVSLTDVSMSMSTDVILMTLMGGMGTFLGPVVGAIVLVTMQSYLAQIGSMVTTLQGAILVACVLVFRKGIVGEIEYRLAQRTSRKAEQP